MSPSLFLRRKEEGEGEEEERDREEEEISPLISGSASDLNINQFAHAIKIDR